MHILRIKGAILGFTNGIPAIMDTYPALNINGNNELVFLCILVLKHGFLVAKTKNKYFAGKEESCNSTSNIFNSLNQ